MFNIICYNSVDINLEQTIILFAEFLIIKHLVIHVRARWNKLVFEQWYLT